MSKKRILSLLAVLVMVISLVAVAVVFNASAADEASSDSIDYEALIPDDKDAQTYPFAVFLNGEYQSVHEKWSDSFTAALALVNDDSEKDNLATIAARRDHATYQADGEGNASSFVTAKGKICVDLNGHTIDVGDRYLISINVTYKDANSYYLGFASSIEIKNGTINNRRTSLPAIGVQHSGTTSADDTKTINFTFTNVKIGFLGGGSSFLNEFTGKSGDAIITNYTFNDCTIDMNEAKAGIPAFAFKDTNKTMVSTVVFNGGKIIAPELTNYYICSTQSCDKVYYEKNDAGEVMTATLPKTANTPAPTGTNKAGDSLSFGRLSATDDTVTYVLGTPVECKYGTIPFRYASLIDYPFLVFVKNGNKLTLYGGDNTFLDTVSSYDNEGALHIAKDAISGNTWDGTSYGTSAKSALILVRTDYKMASNESYNNIAQILGEVVVDLDGYTISAPEGRVMFPATLKAWGNKGVFPSTVTLENGTINLYNSALVTFSGSAGEANKDNPEYLADKHFTFNFNNVNINVLGSTSSVASLYSVNTTTPDVIGYTFVNFTDSTIDISKATANNVTLFSTGNGLMHTTATFTGGEIIGKDGLTFVNDSKDTVGSFSFNKDDEGNYPVLTLPAGVTAPVQSFNDGTLGFAKVAVEDGKATYVLTEAGFNTYLPKMSLTLDSNLIANVYIPVTGTQSFIFNGVNSTDDAELVANVVELDGASYYLVSVALPASEAAKTLTLTANVAFGEKSATGTFTFSLAKYAAKILASESECEKTLVLDVLAYVKSAYSYFNKTNLTDFDALLAGYSSEFATVDGESQNLESLKGATFVLGATPAIRFYLPEGANPADYTFKQGGTVLECTVSEDLTYIDVSLYAHRMIKGIDYYVGETKMGTYHINTYYDYVNGEGEGCYEGADKEALTDIVEKFYTYCKSAAAYKAEVTK